MWNERAVILLAALLALYDLGRGLSVSLHFTADAAASEMPRAKAALLDLARDTLVIGDRLCSTVNFFGALRGQGCWGLIRRERLVSLRKRWRLRKRRHTGGILEDWLVDAGTGVSAPRQTLRYLRWRHRGSRYELLTKVLEPTRLAAPEALALYPPAKAFSACTSI